MGRLRILAIDNEQTNLKALETILEQVDGLEVVHATGGLEALKTIDTMRIHLILVAVEMPHMDGFDFVKELREKDDAKEIPVVFLTSNYKSEDFEAKGYKLGSFDYLIKPVDKDRLLNKVMLYKKLHEKSEELNEAKRKISEITHETKEKKSA